MGGAIHVVRAEQIHPGEHRIGITVDGIAPDAVLRLGKLTAQIEEVIHRPVSRRQLDIVLFKQRGVQDGAVGRHVARGSVQMSVKVQAVADSRIQAVQILLRSELVQLHERAARSELRNLVKRDHHHVDGLAAAASQLDAGQLGQHGLVVIADLDEVELYVVVSVLLLKAGLEIDHADLGRVPPGIDVDGHILGQVLFLRKRRGYDAHDHQHHGAQENREQFLHGDTSNHDYFDALHQDANIRCRQSPH